MNFTEEFKSIDIVINTPTPTPTKEEAREILRNCGILDENYVLKEEYKDILVSKDKDLEKIRAGKGISFSDVHQPPFLVDDNGNITYRKRRF